jgi:hypothetical protein
MTKDKPNPQSQSERPVERKYRAQIKPLTLRLKTAARALDIGEGRGARPTDAREATTPKTGPPAVIVEQARPSRLRERLKH